MGRNPLDEHGNGVGKLMSNSTVWSRIPRQLQIVVTALVGVAVQPLSV